MTESFVISAPDPSFSALPDIHGYLERMAKPLQDKLRMAFFVPPGAKTFLDGGCADGTVTIALARMFPHIQFLGIDLDENFIKLAREHSADVPNVRFEQVYLRQLLMREERYDVVQFCSVLHEFAHYGEGISSVVKAIADAHELLNVGGTINIRDMILHDYTRRSDFQVEVLRQKIEAVCDPGKLADFVALFGSLDSLYTVNHFLLKYMYHDNWARECPENYVATSFEQYQQIFDLLGMRPEHHQSYTLAYLEAKWKSDFNFTAEQMSGLRSTTVLVAKKEMKRR
jgi:SAM-dependent methyltransferase